MIPTKKSLKITLFVKEPTMLGRILAACLLFSSFAFAQTTAIRAGSLVDPAAGTVSKNQVILIKDGKISEVGPRVQIPAGAAVVDLSHSWVLPGLMDAHVHLTLGLPPSPPGESLWESYLLKESTALRAFRGMRNAGLVLEAGFTTVREIGNAANYADSDIRRAIEKGWFPGPTMLNVGKIIAPFGGQFEGIAPEHGPFWGFEYLEADGPGEVRKAVRQDIYHGAKAIKLVADEFSYYYSEEEIRAAVTEAHNAGLTVGVHVTGDKAARNVILGGADSIEHGFRLSDALLELMKEKGTVLVGTDFPYKHLAQMGAMAREPKTMGEQILDRLKRAHRIGVKLAFGTDVVLEFPDRNRAELMLDYLDVWQAAGVPPAKILKCMITQPAELFRLQKERGAIQPGLAADIIATQEDPLENIQALRKVHFVMKEGKIIRQAEATKPAPVRP